MFAARRVSGVAAVSVGPAVRQIKQLGISQKSNN